MSDLKVIERQNKRVLLTAQLAEQYQVDVNNIQNNFFNHKDRFQEGKHYNILQGDELRDLKNQVNNIDLVPKHTSLLYLWTESGALRHAKILDTDGAWEAYEELEDTYFKVRNHFNQTQMPQMSKELQAIFAIDQKQLVFDQRIEKLENTMTIDYGQQLRLNNLAKSKVIEAIGGTEVPAYKFRGGIRGMAFQAIWKDFKDYFKVGTYKDTAVKDFDKAMEYLARWKPNGKLQRDIEDCNNGLQFG